jgi:hypothetical protein
MMLSKIWAIFLTPYHLISQNLSKKYYVIFAIFQNPFRKRGQTGVKRPFQKGFENPKKVKIF